MDGQYPVYGGNGLRGYTDVFNHSGDYTLIGRQGALCGNVRFIQGKSYITEHAIAAKASSKNDTRFLSFLFDKMNLRQYSDQSAQPGLAVNKLLRIQINVPQLNEQVKIARFLSILDARINLQSKVIERYESLIKTINDRKIRLLLKGIVAPFEMLYSRASEGGTPSTTRSEYYLDGQIPFIKIDDLSSMYLTKNKDYITERGLEKSSAWLIPEGSVIYSNGATIGAISINTYPVATKQGILGIVPKSIVLKEYLYFLMCSSYFNKEIQRIVTEGTMKTAYLKDINRVECPLPSLDVQAKIVAGLLSISRMLDNEKRILGEYQSVKRFILSQLFI